MNIKNKKILIILGLAFIFGYKIYSSKCERYEKPSMFRSDFGDYLQTQRR